MTKKIREGWEEAFKQYAKEGEDPLMFPDYIDLNNEYLSSN